MWNLNFELEYRISILKLNLSLKSNFEFNSDTFDSLNLNLGLNFY